jgi:O-antigen ligase
VIVPALACAALAATRRPSVLRNSPAPALDLCLLAVLAAALLQLVPLPRPVITVLSPAARGVEAAFALVAPGGLRPLTINPHDSMGGAAVLAGVILLFVTARRTFDDGGVRTLIRIVAVVGLALSGIALAQDATAKGLMYWRFAADREGPYPFGPFINRNHFATWAMMAAPLCAGYLAAHAAAHPHGDGLPWRRRLLLALDGRTWMLGVSAMLLIIATAASLSRSGLAGLAASMAMTVVLLRRRTAVGGVRPMPAAAPLGLLAAGATLGALALVGAGVIATRFGASRVALADRLAIWHDTLPVMRDFWLTGTGVGTFRASMAVYQRSKPEVIFNQAHNHYLQVAAEGGLLVGVPVCLAFVVLARCAWRRVQADHSAMYFIRAGALSGLIGVAIQSVWETGLTIPANAALAAVLAAIVVHTPVRGAAAER